MARAQITHVLFDMDGLLLDTEGFYTAASDEICQRYGKRFTWEIKLKQMGRTAQESARIFIEETGLPMTWQEYLAEREMLLERMFPHAQLLPGAARLVGHLKAHGIPIAVATSSHTRHFDLKSGGQNASFFKQFDHIVRGDDPDVKRGKPSPDIFLAARARFPNPPACDRVLVFEDAPTGVAAALAAGMHVVMVPDANVPEKDRVGASQVLASLDQFRPEEWGLPPFP